MRLAAEKSRIFCPGFLALKEKVVLYVEVELPDHVRDRSLLDDISSLPLGGEGRHASLSCLPEPFSWPDVKPEAGKKPLLLLTTPCAFQAGWRPTCLDGLVTAAAVPPAQPFSGWDLARGGPKPTRFAAPAGAVYFLESLPDGWAHTLAESGEERQQGWGCCLTGVWADE